jgi:hypothetical protein
MTFLSIQQKETAMNDGNDFCGVEKFAGVVRVDDGQLR